MGGAEQMKARRDTTADIMRRTCGLVGHAPIPPVRGSTEPAAYFQAVALALGLELTNERGRPLSKQALARRVVEAAGLTWEPAWQGMGKKHGGSISNPGLLAMEQATAILVGVEGRGASSPPPASRTVPTRVDGGERLGVVEPGTTTTTRKQRIDAAVFRRRLLDLYGYQCAITGCGVKTVLDGAHVDPYSRSFDNSLANGLILRRDVHALFDGHYLMVEPTTRTVWLHPDLASTSDYGALSGVSVRPPRDARYDPGPALARIWAAYGPQ